MKISSPDSWSRNLMFGLAIAGFLWCGQARAAIALQDGSTNTFNADQNYFAGVGTNVITATITVTAGASVLVVSTYDQNNVSFDTQPNLASSGDWTFTPCAEEWDGGSPSSSSDIFYLFSPDPGTQTITVTDASGNTPSAMTIQAYTLSGVDTTVAPAFYAANNAGSPYGYSASVSVTGNPAGAWAALSCSISYDDATHAQVLSTSGSPGYHKSIHGNVPGFGGQCVMMGGIANMAYGNATVVLTNGASGAGHALAMAIFTPSVSASAPTPPVNLVATGQTNQVALTWQDSSGGRATGYIVLRSTTTGSGYVQIGACGSTNYTDAAVTNWTTYYYVVDATNAAGASLQSSEAGATPVGVPAAPTGLSANWGVNLATLTWNTQVGATNWNLLRSTNSGSGFTPIASLFTTNYTDAPLVNFTTYYYELNASNSFGTGPNSAPVPVIPSVPITNWIGIFHGPNDVTNWFNTVSNGNFGGGYASFYPDAPTNGPSTGCLLFSNVFWNGVLAGWDGIQGRFNNLNESNATALEFDVKVEGNYDSINQIQALQPSVESTHDSGLGYQWGTPTTATSNQWLHVVMPITGDDAGNVVNWSGINQINLNVVDGYYTNATMLLLGYANFEFTGAPGYPPIFSGLTNDSIAAGIPSVTLSGKVSGIFGNYLVNGTPVTVTIDGNTEATAINDNTGDFTINYTGLAGLSGGIYPITYASASDYQIFLAGSNNATSLTVIGSGPPPPSIQFPKPPLDPTGKNLMLYVATQAGHSYYLLTATNLNPPVVWTTNTSFAGTGGMVTNSVPLNSAKAVFLKYQVN